MNISEHQCHYWRIELLIYYLYQLKKCLTPPSPRPVPDPEPYPGRAHLRQLPPHGPDEPEHGGQQRVVHRHGPGPPLPSLRLCRRLPHQGEHI